MNIKELLKVKVENPEIYIEEFKSLLQEIRSNKYDFKDRESTNSLIMNEFRLKSHFIHIVPRELLPIFDKMKNSNPEQFLGFSILVEKRDNQDIRLSCFGIPCSDLTKAIL